MGAIICSLVTIDTIRELYFISTAWGHEATWHDILYIVRKYLPYLGGYYSLGMSQINV